MPLPARPPILVVVQQHADDSASLRHVRSVLVRAPHVKLLHLGRLDERIAAHLDGLAVAGDYGTALATAALERPGAGEVFALAVRHLEERDAEGLERLLALAAALPAARRGLLSAMGWVSAVQLQGIVRPLLASRDPWRRELGLAACRLHRADPGALLAAAVADPHPGLRAEALRTAGELGRLDRIAGVLDAMSAASGVPSAGTDPAACTSPGSIADAETAARCRAALSACLLGQPGAALETLAEIAFGNDASRDIALAMLLLAAPIDRGRALLRELGRGASADPARQRRLIRACGLLGSPHIVPWLIELMPDDRHARLAGEAFTMISGADLAALDLERKPPAHVDAGPNDDPDDDNVAMDEDDSLPWPDAARVAAWWQARGAAMAAAPRLLLGAPPSPAQAELVLREGRQRQRAVAAQWLCLLGPGRRLFNIAAPTRRQVRELPAAAATAA